CTFITIISIISVNGLLYRRRDPSLMLRPIGRRTLPVDEDFQYPGYYDRRELHLRCCYYSSRPISRIPTSGRTPFCDGWRRGGRVLYGINPHLVAYTRPVGGHPRDDSALFGQPRVPRTV